MEYIAQLGLVALGSRMRAVSDRLYATADEVYRQSGLDIQGRWLPLLRILHDRGPLTVGEIAEAIFVAAAMRNVLRTLMRCRR